MLILKSTTTENNGNHKTYASTLISWVMTSLHVEWPLEISAVHSGDSDSEKGKLRVCTIKQIVLTTETP